MNDQGCRIRVVVPCHNSDSTIEKCISSILESRNLNFELIIVDDGSNTRLDLIKNNFPVGVIKTSGNEGAGKARNLGTTGFKGNIVVFIDSDVQVLPDTLSLLVAPLLECTVQAAVGSYSRSRRNNFFETYKHYYLAYRYSDRENLVNNFWSAICAVDFDAFMSLKGFKQYSGAGPEDIDFGIALTAAGHKIVSVPEAAGTHLATYNFTGLIKNDLRKGMEDIYIHWKRRISLRCNRHVSRSDMIAVFLACSIPLLLALQHLTGLYIPLACSLLYLAFKIRFLTGAFHGESLIFMLKSSIMTFILDIIRGISVLSGTILYLFESVSYGRFKPFLRITAE